MKTTAFIGAAVGALFLAGPVAAAPLITVKPWLAANIFGSPSWPAAESNAIAGMLAGGQNTGTGPGRFEVQSTAVSAAEVVVTGFNSWRGVVDPGAAFGAAYANELGNRMAFALYIDGQGQQFSIDQLGFSAVSTDANNALGFGFATGSYNYSSSYRGILFGGDGAFGGGDDIFVTSGAANQMVDALVGRGSGNSMAAYCPGCDTTAQAAAIAAATTWVGAGPVTFTGTYTLGAASASGAFTILAVPEPGSLSLAGLALLALGGGALRRRRDASPRRVA